MSHDMTAIADQLRQAGYRVTPQRQIILDAICALGGHVAPEAVYEYVKIDTPTLNRATVYRTLSFLAEQRIITVTSQTNGRLCYEIATSEPHHHLVCRQCDHSIELQHAELTRFIQAVKADYDFDIDMDHISFFGVCSYCRQNKNKL